ncbi:hypothetical protein FDP41_012799 [Naegleria fowleri]|uniref:Roadblock/LAMTOR2 domain-containing protein n=1 Tax=Naegleria fowleri TaxID=5763 RepID=A0A6A5C1W6_NAEFO|nr:uncharacterized protein FDP41_012799 [Naegleria fowleri]KAF0981011.1 hypothetical protein FDP41_012799 [Naegleria fowleri]CAG4716588.1 unnamed protein product [Naegleria fowleri]
MLQPRLLPKVLEQINTDGIKTTILCNVNGSLISSSLSTSAKQIPSPSSAQQTSNNITFSEQQITYQQRLLPSQIKHMDKLIAAIAANMWHSYQKAGRTAFSPVEYDENGNMIGQEDDENLEEESGGTQKLKTLLVDCEYGRLAILGVSRNVVLCVCAEKEVPFGSLNKKAQVMRDFLSRPFTIVEEAVDEEEEEEY